MATPALISFVLAMILVRLLADRRFPLRIVDIPNKRSLHETPVPRTGGLGLLLAAVITWMLLSGWELAIPVILAGGLAGLSLVDDIRSLPVSIRLAAQSLAAVALLAVYDLGPWLGLALALLCIVWMANLYNFMDGSDGLAGGMTAIGFGAYAVAAGASGAQDLALLAASIAGAALGLIVWNFPPARIFMGDAGSVPLGFLAAALGLLGWQRAVWPLWFPALVFSPFIVDATATLLARLVRGEKLHEAHKTHYYQRALRLGLGHRGTALSEYALMLAAAASALMSRAWSPLDAALLGLAWVAIYIALMWAINRRWKTFERTAAP